MIEKTTPGERTARLEVNMDHVLKAIEGIAEDRKHQSEKLDDLSVKMDAVTSGLPKLKADVTAIREDIDILKSKATFIAGMAVAFGMIGSFLGVTLATAKQWFINAFGS